MIPALLTGPDEVGELGIPESHRDSDAFLAAVLSEEDDIAIALEVLLLANCCSDEE